MSWCQRPDAGERLAQTHREVVVRDKRRQGVAGQSIRVGVVRIFLSSAIRIGATFRAQSEQQRAVAIKFEDLMQSTVGDPYAVCMVDKHAVWDDKSMVTSEAAKHFSYRARESSRSRTCKD